MFDARQQNVPDYSGGAHNRPEGKPVSRDFTPDDIAEIIRLYKPQVLGGAGMTVNGIAARYNTTERIIKNLLIRNKAFMPPIGSDKHANPNAYTQPSPTDTRKPWDNLNATDPYGEIYASQLITLYRLGNRITEFPRFPYLHQPTLRL
jgi:hypothetical protein